MTKNEKKKRAIQITIYINFSFFLMEEVSIEMV